MTPLASRFSDIYMTPEDFVRSITPGVMQPKNLGLDKYQIYHADVSQIKIYYISINYRNINMNFLIRKVYFIN